MHDINLIYSQYMVDKVLEERREEAAAWRREKNAESGTPLRARVMALLRWQGPGVAGPPASASPKAEGARA